MTREPIYYCGWCDKEGGSVKSWKRRFLILYRNRIEYFTKSVDHSSLKGQRRVLLSKARDLTNCCSVLPLQARSCWTIRAP